MPNLNSQLRIPNSRLRAFTLLEVLLVVLIISILIALSVPSLARARKTANRTSCGAQLHSLGNGLQVYLAENNFVMPLSAMMPSINAPVEPLPVTLSREVPGAKAWHCPADNNGYTRLTDAAAFDSYFAGEGTSYEYSMTLGGKQVNRWFLYSLFGEHGTYVLSDFDAFHAPKGTVNSKNILFADSHIGTIEDITNALGLPQGPATSTAPAP
jgi:prepilin-type N-terminal cleavage/methylation domain-containing protein